MTTRSDLRLLFSEKSFSQHLGDEAVELVRVHDVLDLIEEHFVLRPKGNSFEYGYAKSGTLTPRIVLIGDEQAYQRYLADLQESPTSETRRYYRRPREIREWEEIAGPDAAYLS